MATTPAPAERRAPPRLVLTQLCRDFPAGAETVRVLDQIDLVIEPGEMVAIIGASGSGKSTLMNILGCLDRPSSGTYVIGDRATSGLAPDELAELRREHFGFIFQRYHLLPDLSAQANVEVPAIYAGQRPADRRIRSADLLGRLGMSERLTYRPGQLSGGQQQRVSIARALMNGGEIVLADEPTGALDSTSGEEVMRILKGLHAEGHTVLVVTHDARVAEHCSRVFEIKDGRIIGDRAGQGVGEVAPPGSVGLARASRTGFAAALDRLTEAFAMAVLSMMAHKLRTFLTMLGIIIGIAAVIAMVAIGAGASQMISDQIAVIDENTIVINGTAYQADPSLAQITPQGPILAGVRDASGVLTLTVFYSYCSNDYAIWETPPYRGIVPETWEPTGGLLPSTIIQLTGKTQAQLDADNLSSLQASLVSQVDAYYLQLQNAGFPFNVNKFGFSQDKVTLATGVKVDLLTGVTLPWPLPWPTVTGSTTFDQPTFTAFATALSNQVLTVASLVGNAKTAILSATNTADAQAAYDSFAKENPL